MTDVTAVMVFEKTTGKLAVFENWTSTFPVDEVGFTFRAMLIDAY